MSNEDLGSATIPLILCTTVSEGGMHSTGSLLSYTINSYNYFKVKQVNRKIGA